jgi:hypothetical protein
LDGAIDRAGLGIPDAGVGDLDQTGVYDQVKQPLAFVLFEASH